jgi:hypothetical protein
MATSVFDLAVPRRPTLTDVGGAAKENDPVAPPPDPVSMLTADDVNQWALLLQAIGRCVPLIMVFFSQSGGVYTCTKVISPRSALHDSQATFPFTKLGTGRLHFGTNLNTSLPSSTGEPVGWLDFGITQPGGVIASRINAGYDNVNSGGRLWVNIDNGTSAEDRGFGVALW